MKHFLCLTFVFILTRAFAQVPVMNPISGSTVTCSNPAAPLSYTASASNSPTSYSWSVLPSSSVVILSPSAAVTDISFPYSTGTYTLFCFATNGSGASSTVSFVVTVFETPSVSFSGSNTFCQGSSTNLSASSTILAASPTVFYNWSPGFGLNTTVGPNVIANPSVTTNYTVTATKGVCSNTAQITVSQISSPTVTAYATNSIICFGSVTTLTANGANSYNWTNSVINGIPFTPLSSTIYYVTGYAINGCADTKSVLITVNPAPSVIINSNYPFLCAGQTGSLALSGSATSFSLNNLPVASNFTFAPTSTTNYTITGSNSFGCITTEFYTQVVSPCVGLQDKGLSPITSFHLFPNPTNGSFKVRSEIRETITIINEFGQLIRSIELIPQEEYSISNLTPGIYIIQSATLKAKLIVTHY
jgi:hypothetical protein